MKFHSFVTTGLVAFAVHTHLRTRREVPVVYTTKPGFKGLPIKGSTESAGSDIRATQDFDVAPGTTYIMPAGFTARPPRGYYLSLQTRSGLSIKSNLILANGTEGVIDSDFDQEIKVALRNVGDTPITFKRGDRVAQLLVKDYVEPRWVFREGYHDIKLRIRDTISHAKGHSRVGGLGSTGLH